MKALIVFCLIGLVSCSHHRGPASVGGLPVAYDSMAWGNVQASAVKRSQNQDLCFDIDLVMKNVKPEQAQASNWTLAWVDEQNHYHLLPVTQRGPASTPQGSTITTPYYYYEEYKSSFSACAPAAKASEAKRLVLTPKELPYRSKELSLSWE